MTKVKLMMDTTEAELLKRDRRLISTWELYVQYLEELLDSNDIDKGIKFLKELDLHTLDYTWIPSCSECNKLLITGAAFYSIADQKDKALDLLQKAFLFDHHLPGFYSEQDFLLEQQERQVRSGIPVEKPKKLEQAFFDPYFVDKKAPSRTEYHFKSIESTPFCWIEKGELNRKQQWCRISKKMLKKGDSLYKYRFFTGANDSPEEFDIIDAKAFENNDAAVKNKERYESNKYKLEDYNYNTNYCAPYISRFYKTLTGFNLQATLETIASPPVYPTQYILNSFTDKFERKFLEDDYVNGQGGGPYVELLYVLIKCGYLTDIIKLLPQLPSHMPYLMLLFDSDEVRFAINSYLNNENHGKMIDIAIKTFSRRKSQTLIDLAIYGKENPLFLENLAICLNLYEFHFFDEYYHYPNWNIPEFSFMRKAKSVALLDFFITDIKSIPILMRMKEELALPTASVEMFGTDRLAFSLPFLCRTIALNLAWHGDSKYELWFKVFSTFDNPIITKAFLDNTMKIIESIKTEN
ncbi:hypothetical protein [Spirochaeta cellobiosiphila]|uniref:hypothetical protein n=1 Tax=Spirochaeta cellobiosiphila TaxID=504483 RepID=UPI00056C5140|nr:hypothetical protein [Spirochaeta cellobiosiphila]